MLYHRVFFQAFEVSFQEKILGSQFSFEHTSLASVPEQLAEPHHLS